MEDKHARLAKIKELLTKIKKEVDMEGIIFYAAACPNDETPEDVSTPAFYLAAGDHQYISSLIGHTLGDLMLKAEQDAGTGPDQSYRLFVLEMLVMAANHSLSGSDPLPETEEEEEPEIANTDDVKKAISGVDDETSIIRRVGVRFIKKGGTA